MKTEGLSMWWFGVALLSSAFFPSYGAYGETLATGGVAIVPERSVIVARAVDFPAAEELQLHLALVSGRDIPISAQAAEGAYAFSFDGPLPGANPEAAEWTVTPSGVSFRGNAYFAVVDFLENALEIRWPEGDKISYTAQNPIRISELHHAWTPELRLRVVRAELTNRVNQVFRRRMRTGSHDAPKYGHAFTKYWTLYGAKHPEWFAMREDGLRGPVGATPKELAEDVAVYAANKKNRVAICCASTGLVAQVVANWRAEGSPAYLNICENDVYGKASCHCPDCRALDVVPDKADENWEKHYADRYVHFGNEVLKLARETRPDVKVCYYAYNATQEAPGREHPLEGTVIGLVPTIFTDESIRRYVESWKRAGATEFFYRPNQHHYFTCPFLPIGSEEHFYEILQYLRSQGTIGFDYDAHAAVEGGFEWFERYVLFHAMQDPSKPFSFWEDHFCSAYGAAAADVKDYFRYWRNEVWAVRLEPNLDEIVRKGKFFNFGRGLVHNLKDYYRLDDFAAAERHLAAAESRDLPKAQRELVRCLRTAHDHARLFFKAVAEKSADNTRALIDYRRRFGYPLMTWSEDYFGDITGIEAMLGIKYQKESERKRQISEEGKVLGNKVALSRELTEAKVWTSEDGTTLSYRLHLPTKSEAGRLYPLVIHMHGAGSRGNDNAKQLNAGGSDFLSWMTRRGEECVFLAPQCPAGEKWVDVAWGTREHRMKEEPTVHLRKAMEIIADAMARYPVDRSRVYVMGISMGGYATWELLQRHPDWFAAALPCCGGGDITLAARMKKVAIWVFHGEKDPVVPVYRAQSMVAALKGVGGNVTYREYPETGHNAWTPTFTDDAVFDWLWQQQSH